MRIALAMVALLAGCGIALEPDDAGPGDAGVPIQGGLTTITESGDTGASGELAITVPVDEGARSFLLAGTSADGQLAVLSIDDPSGATVVRWQDWVDVHTLTDAFYASAPAVAMNWPIRDVDPPLVPGDYVVHVGSYRADGVTVQPNVALETTTFISRDQDLSRGLVHVVIVWAAGLGDDAALVSATEAAVAHWSEVWAGADMALDVRYVQSSIDPALPYPGPMSAPLLTASQLAVPGEVPVIIGETVNDDLGQYGVAGDIPGPLAPTVLSAIVIGWLANAGGDGVFSENDIQLYGEVLAHEVGHFLGLAHPVESTYDAWDALDDTVECTSATECEDRLGMNLMFPYSIGCDTGTCLSTTQITAQQRGVMQRYTGTF